MSASDSYRAMFAEIDCPRLQVQVLKAGIDLRRAKFDDINRLFESFPTAKAFFNCTGLGSYSLKGVEDHNVYPTKVRHQLLSLLSHMTLGGPTILYYYRRLYPETDTYVFDIQGQILLVETPSKPLEKMYFRSPKRVASDTTYVFPRFPHGGVVLGGCRLDGVWDGNIDLDFAEDIKRRCCALCPDLGKPEDLKVLYHAVGLRRKSFLRCMRAIRPETVVDYEL